MHLWLLHVFSARKFYRLGAHLPAFCRPSPFISAASAEKEKTCRALKNESHLLSALHSPPIRRGKNVLQEQIPKDLTASSLCATEKSHSKRVVKRCRCCIDRERVCAEPMNVCVRRVFFSLGRLTHFNRAGASCSGTLIHFCTCPYRMRFIYSRDRISVAFGSHKCLFALCLLIIYLLIRNLFCSNAQACWS
jgi:hypothetical protein